ncbi:hypothetical protein MOQ72_26910 [Saccharopolyspora sp. K220]|uniref:thioesterase, FlK family n=1 Tax=Saccharopolyspora soli TaxID=2926618 RepID=UPI001F59BFED|nr:hypothetical protein [Saccharopolyspora soli]MCI2421079.1 hypothetical protein [Saccharopolyspora soli]
MRPGLPLGQPHSYRYEVPQELTVPWILHGSQLEQHGEPVLASGLLLAMCEDASWRVLAPFRDEDDTTVGWHFEFRHLAPSVEGDSLDITTIATDLVARDEQTWDVRWRTEVAMPRLSRPAAVIQHRLRVQPRSRFLRRLPTAVLAPTR